MNALRRVASLIVTKTQLTIDIETPCEKNALVGKGGNMSETCSTLNEVFTLFRFNLDLLWKLKETLVFHSKLAEACLTPAPYITILGYGQAEERATGDIVDRLAIERLDVLGSTSDLDAFANAELALEATAPSVNIGFVR